MKNRTMYRKITVDYAPMQDLLIDIKTMPQAFGGYYLLMVISATELILLQQYLLDIGRHKPLPKH